MADSADTLSAAKVLPVFLAIRIMSGRLNERQIEIPVPFSTEGLQTWLRTYQNALEREIIARLTKIVIPGDNEKLIAVLDQEIESRLEEDPDF